jgi:trigger factor
MKVEIKEINSCMKELKIEVPKDAVSEEYENVYQELGKKVKIKGFRKGKVPRNVLERNYKDTVESDVMQNLISDSYFKALQENEIRALGKPKVDNIELKIDSPFSYTAIVEIVPEIKVSDYKGLEFTKKVVKISDKDVDEELKYLRERMAKYEVDENSPAEEHDYIIISFESFIDNTPDEEGKRENLPVTIGRKMIYPELENKLIGMKKGENKEIEITFPEDYTDKKVAGKDVKFNVTVNEVKKRILPDLNDDIAKEIGEYKTLEELKNTMKEEMIKMEGQQADTRLRRNIVDKLIEMNEIEVPKILVEEEMRLMFYDTQQRLKAQGYDLDDAAIELDKIKEGFKEPANREVKSYLIVDKISELEKVEVAEKEMDEKIQDIAKSINQDFHAFKQKMIENGSIEKLRNQMGRDKTLDILINDYTIIEKTVEKEEILKDMERADQ